MKKNIILLILLISTTCLSAQTLDFSKLEGRWDTTKTVQLTILRIGTQHNMFIDYGQLTFDSISASIARGESQATSAGPKLISALKSIGFQELILLNRETKKEFIQCKAGGLQRYQYEEDTPQLKWELLQGDSTIAGYQCQKAKTRLFGRDYIAWYAPEVELPYGPYKFCGLPGLIFKVQDTQDNFVFTLTGLQKVKSYTPIYMHDKSAVTKSTRKTVRQMYKNYCADPVKALTGDGSITVSADVAATVNAKPYNPIELE